MKTDTEKLALLLSILNDYCDTVDGSDGEPEPNMAMGILCDYEMRQDYGHPANILDRAIKPESAANSPEQGEPYSSPWDSARMGWLAERRVSVQELGQHNRPLFTVQSSLTALRECIDAEMTTPAHER